MLYTISGYARRRGSLGVFSLLQRTYQAEDVEQAEEFYRADYEALCIKSIEVADGQPRQSTASEQAGA